MQQHVAPTHEWQEKWLQMNNELQPNFRWVNQVADSATTVSSYRPTNIGAIRPVTPVSSLYFLLSLLSFPFLFLMDAAMRRLRDNGTHKNSTSVHAYPDRL